jgi:hypothetical protein
LKGGIEKIIKKIKDQKQKKYIQSVGKLAKPVNRITWANTLNP